MSEGDGMVTDEDREKAYGLVYRDGPAIAEVGGYGRLIEAIAAALAEERRKARAPLLALAEELEQEFTEVAQRSGIPAAYFAKVWRSDCPDRIRRAAEEG